MRLSKVNLNSIKHRISPSPTVLFNCGWMELYDGPADIYGGGSYVKENGTGWEIFNFADFNGKVYGYAQPSGETNHIERIGALKEAESIDSVLAIFTATHPRYGGLYVVGWYHDAILYRNYQDKKSPDEKSIIDGLVTTLKLSIRMYGCFPLMNELALLSCRQNCHPALDGKVVLMSGTPIRMKD